MLRRLESNRKALLVMAGVNLVGSFVCLGMAMGMAAVIYWSLPFPIPWVVGAVALVGLVYNWLGFKQALRKAHAPAIGKRWKCGRRARRSGDESSKEVGGLGVLLMVSGFAALYTGVKLPGLNEVLAGWLEAGGLIAILGGVGLLWYANHDRAGNCILGLMIALCLFVTGALMAFGTTLRVAGGYYAAGGDFGALAVMAWAFVLMAIAYVVVQGVRAQERRR